METGFGKLKTRLAAAPWLPFAALFALAFLYFLTINRLYGDDEVFLAALAGTTPVQMALDYRQSWSARIVIELVQFHFYALPPVVWKLAFAAGLTLLAWCFSKLSGTLASRSMNWLACAVVCVYPLGDMLGGAGWVATSCNYLLPLALGLYALSTWVDRFYARPVRGFSWVLSLCALVYAANAEQMWAVLVGFALVGVVAMVKTRRRPPVAVLAGWLLVLAGMAVQRLFAPGLALRLAEESARFAPNPNPLVRLYEVFTEMSWYLLVNGTFLSVLFCAAVVALAVFARRTAPLARGIAAVPLAFCLVFGLLYPNLRRVLPTLQVLKENMMQDGMAFMSDATAFLPAILYLAVWAALLYGLWQGAGSPAAAKMAGLVFLAGFCAQLIMLVVPSAASSVQRHTIYLHIALLLCAFLLLVQLAKDQFARPLRQGRILTAVAAGGSLLNLLFTW